ncbi:hypothetical protein A5881_000474 [Enterococcus termitis]
MSNNLEIIELPEKNAPGATKDFIEGFGTGLAIVGTVCAFFGC